MNALPSSDLAPLAAIAGAAPGDSSLAAQLQARYLELQCLSDTASATVWRGRDAATQALCVVKAFSPDSQCAYRREAAVALGIKHANVVRCLDTFVLPDGHACLVYEYATQGSLADFSKSVALHGHLVTQAIADILQALHTLHQLGYVHCDIKPANILVTQLASGVLEFKLGDLGSCATLKEAQSGKHGIGSPAYCAPERLYNQFGYASDIYSVGVTAYELLTGHLPFIGEVEEVYRAHLTRPPALGEISQARWREWLEQALHKQPTERFLRAELALAALLPQAEPLPAGAAPVQAAPRPVASIVAYPGGAPAATGGQAVSHQRWQPSAAIALDCTPSSLALLAQSQAVCLGSERGLQLLYPDTALRARVTPARPPYASLGDCLYYHSGGRLVEYDATRASQHTLLDNLSQPLAIAAGSAHVAFAEARRVVVQRRSDQAASCVIRHRHYAMETLLALSDGVFAMTSGLANQELVLRSLDGDVLAHVVAQGPWLCLAATPGGFVAASACLDQPGVLHLTQLGPSGVLARHAVAVSSLAVAASARGWFVLDDAGTLQCMDLAGECQPLASDLQQVSLCAASPNGQRCAVVSQRGGKPALGLWTLAAHDLNTKEMP